jgi:hypothetical protein
MKTVAWILGLIGILLVVDAVLSLGFGEKYISVLADYAPVEYVNFVYDITHSSTEIQLFMRLGEIFMGFIMIMVAQKMD